MDASTPTRDAPGSYDAAAEIHETHTGVVTMIGTKAYKVKKPVRTDFLDFRSVEQRERACRHEVQLNRRLAPDSYLGVAHLSDPLGGPAEPVIVMQRYPDTYRLSSMVRRGEPTETLERHLTLVAELLADFHRRAERSEAIDAAGRPAAVSTRWQDNITELRRYTTTVLPAELISETEHLVNQFITGRSVLFTDRIADRRIIDGHGDLLADDIFGQPEGPVLLDCLEFDDGLRHVDGIDDAAFLAMDLEFLGRRDLADHFLQRYRKAADDPAPTGLVDFYIAYRAVVRAKVGCIRADQGGPGADADARRHLELAVDHLRAGTVRLILIGGGPGTGKTTLARGLGDHIGAQVISTDDVRKELVDTGVIDGEPGTFGAGLYSPEKVAAVYDAVLQKAAPLLAAGHTVILDGTWRDRQDRDRARDLARRHCAPMVEFACTVPLREAEQRIAGRRDSTSDATPEVAAAIAAEDTTAWDAAHHIDTRRSLAESVAEAHAISCLAI
ncbi:bifunctional aminoglycoside phosphotransferase/ATP-binding protein [Mycolicibacterium thermoresistibile]